MKKRPVKYFTLLFLIGMGLIHPVSGQEGGIIFHDEEQHEKVNVAGAEGSHQSERQKTHHDDEDKGVSKPKLNTPKESLHKAVGGEQNHTEKEQNNSTIETQNKKEDSDSVLSFNFLHYIIQKFKFSDVIDQ